MPPQKAKPLTTRKIDKIILHCSDNPNPNEDIADVRKFHTDPPPPGRGWRDVGYHFFIKSNGDLQPGRHLDQQGAHVQSHNAHSIGICLSGRHNFAPAQFTTLKNLLVMLHAHFPKATIHGHNEFTDKKTCPNFNTQPIKDFWLTIQPD